MPLYIEENNNTKKIEEFYINDIIIKSVLKGYIGISGISKIFYEKNSYNTDIPEGYTRIPYILNDSVYDSSFNSPYQMNNVTYIDTGIKGYKTVELKAENSSQKMVAGQNESGHPLLYINDNVFIYLDSIHNSDLTRVWHYYEVSNKTYYCIEKHVPFLGEYYLKDDEHYKAETEGSLYTFKTDINIPEESDDNNILLLGIPLTTRLNVSNYRIGQQQSNIKLYYCKIYEDSTKTTILRDFVPVRRDSDGRLGLFDLISRTFFDNTFPPSYYPSTTTQ